MSISSQYLQLHSVRKLNYIIFQSVTVWYNFTHQQSTLSSGNHYFYEESYNSVTKGCSIIIHSFWPFLQRPFKSSTTRRRSRLQHGYCIRVSRRSAQATIGKKLAQGPYVAARAGVKPTTLRLKVIDSTKVPRHPILAI